VKSQIKFERKLKPAPPALARVLVAVKVPGLVAVPEL